MDFEFRDNPITNAVDILSYIGADNYTVPAILHEGRNWGISKRIPLQSVPDGFVPYASRLFGWHSQAIPVVREGSIVDLVDELRQRGLLDLDVAQFREFDPSEALLPDDYVPDDILAVTCAIQADRKTWAELDAKYDIAWQGGVIFYTILGPIQMVASNIDEELPEELAADGRFSAVYVAQYYDKHGNLIKDHRGDDGEQED